MSIYVPSLQEIHKMVAFWGSYACYAQN